MIATSAAAEAYVRLPLILHGLSEAQVPASVAFFAGSLPVEADR
jgi:hypothetical protein